MNDQELQKDVLDRLTFAIAEVDQDHKICGYNRRFFEWFSSAPNKTKSFDGLVGLDFYRAIGFPYFFDGTYAPFYFAERDNKTTRTVVGEIGDAPRPEDRGFEPRLGDCKRIFALLVTPLDNSGFLVEMQDISQSSRLEHQIETLKSAGAELTEVTDPKQALSEEARKEKLKELIKKHMHQTLRYDVFEIRVLSADSQKRLLPFLSIGLNEDASKQVLYAQSNGNGITGYVADSGEPYICDFRDDDTHFIPGAINAKSSLTVPLFQGNRVIGVCNVESENPHEFSKRDETFLQLYAKDLALALSFQDALTTREQHLKAKFLQLLDDNLTPGLSSLYDGTCAVSADAPNEMRHQSLKNVENALELKKRVDRLKRDLLNSSESRYRDLPYEWQKSLSLHPEAAEYLWGKRVLCVFAPEEITVDPITDAWTTVRRLEKLGCFVDVVRSSKAALGALRQNDSRYDMIITDRNPDGYYIVESSTANGRNRYGCNLFDVHDRNYFSPIDNDAEDAVERNRIYLEIASGKTDAFFLKLKIDSLSLRKQPLFIVRVNEGAGIFHDHTHVLNGLSELNRKRTGLKTNYAQPSFQHSERSITPFLKSVVDALFLRTRFADSNESLFS